MDGEQMVRVKDQVGEIDAAKLIYNLLDDLRIALGVEASRELEEALVGASFRVIKEFWFMKFEEIVLCVQGCKEGRYGKSYGKLTVEKIFEWLDVYDRQRTELCDEYHLIAKNSAGSAADRSHVPIFEKSIFEQTVDDAVEKRIKAFKKKRK